MDYVQWIGAGAMFSSGVLSLALVAKLYRPDFLSTKSRLRLIFALGYLFFGVSVLFLVLMRFSLMAQNSDLGIISAYIGGIWAAIVVFCTNIFAIYACFPNQIKKWGIVAIILNTIHILGIISTFNGLQVDAYSEVVFPFYYTVMFFIVPTAILSEVVVIFIYYSYTMRAKSRPHSRRALWFAIGYVAVSTAYFVEVIKISEIVNYTRLLFIVGIIIEYIAFTQFIELEWPTKVRHLYLIHQEKGFSLYNHSFIKEDLVDSQLIAGGISGIASLLQELTSSSDKVKIIDLERLKILIEYGNYIIGALITEENYRILRNKLRQLVKLFEDQYKDRLINFKGQIYEFEDTKALIDEVFHYENIF